MQTRKKRASKRQASKKTGRFVLESLDSRVLLNASAEWLAGPVASHDFFDDNHDIESPSGYALADLTYADPFLWDSMQEAYSLGPISTEQADSLIQSLNDEKPAATISSISISESLALSQNSNQVTAALASSTYTLYLDFDGGTATSRSGDFWLGSESVNIPAYSLSSFGWAGQEQTSINLITNYIKEDYAAYNINVTTAKPASGEYTTMYVGGGNDWFRPGSGVIGVATYDVGNVDASNYGFAFTNELDVYVPYCSGDVTKFSEYVANLVSHEAAHTYGLNHIDDVNELMNPYLPISPRVSMFGKGTISGSSSTQDSQSLLGSNIGYAHGADDYGSTLSAAQSVTINTNVSGLLERRDDQDAFRFTAAQAGNITLDIDTPAYGNLNSYLKVIRNSDQTVIAQNDNYVNGSNDSLLTFAAQAGQTYTAFVSSSNSASLGSYTLKLTGQLPDPEPQIAVTDNVGASGDHIIGFGSVIAGTDHSAVVTIANNGTANLTISQLAVTGNFTLNTVCTAGSSADDLTIAPGASKAIAVYFEPQNEGSYTGQLTIYSNDADSPAVAVTLTGYAEQTQSNISVVANGLDISGDTLNFGQVVRGQTSQQEVTIINTGSDDLIITSLTLSDDFTIVSGLGTLPLTLAPAHSVDVILSADSDHRGSIDGSLVIASNDPDQPVTDVGLTAKIVGGVLTVTESSQTPNDNQLNFGLVRVGQTAQQTLTLTNSGDAPLTLEGLTAGVGFTLNTTLNLNQAADDVVLDPGEQMVVMCSVNPSQMIDYTGTITIITDNSEATTATVQLAASGAAGILEINELDGANDGYYTAGSVQTGQNNLFNACRLTNTGNATMTVNLGLAAKDDFQIIGDNTIVLSPGQSYTVPIVLNTDWAGNISDLLTITADDLTYTQDSMTLTAAGYAMVGAGQKYRFTDHTGDLITVSLTGDALAKLTLGDGAITDIQTIELISGTSDDTLAINVKGDGRTLLGEIIGDVSLKAINAQKVDLVGDGIDINGSVSQLKLGNVLSGADIAFNADSPVNLSFDQVVGNSDININGSINKLKIVRFSDGSLTANAINTASIQNQFNAVLNVSSGDINTFKVLSGNLDGEINVNGSIGNITVSQGNLTASLNAEQDIERVMVRWGDVAGQINAGQSIGRIDAMNIRQADIAAESHIDQINVKNEMADSLVVVGPTSQTSLAGITPLGSEPDSVWLSTLKVRGVFSGTTIAVGVAPDNQGNYLNASSAVSSGAIGRVELNQVVTQNNQLPFGLCVRDAILKAKINQQSLSGDYQQDDFYINILNH